MANLTLEHPSEAQSAESPYEFQLQCQEDDTSAQSQEDVRESLVVHRETRACEGASHAVP